MKSDIEIFKTDYATELELQYAPVLMAGFPSPADDYMRSSLDLTKELVHHPETTFYARVGGESMKDLGIGKGDYVIIDRSLEAADGDVVVAWVNDGFTIKRLDKSHQSEGYILLQPANEEFSPIRVNAGDNFILWGVVTYTVKSWR